MGIFGLSSKNDLRATLENSPVVEKLKEWVDREFMNVESRTMEYLKEGNYASFEVQDDGVILSIGKAVYGGGSVGVKYADRGKLHFSTLGYGNLPNKRMAPILKELLLEEVRKSNWVSVNKHGGIGFDSSKLSKW